MIFDKDVLYSDAQDLAQTAAAYASTNIIDHGLIGDTSRPNPIAFGNPIRLFIKVVEAFTSAGAPTLTVAWQQDDNAAFSSPTTLFTTSALVKATLVVGYDFPELPRFVHDALTQRYSRFLYTIATATTTAGKITAGLISDVQSNDANTP